ncbi:tail fiber assembly protein [Citrobacter freundii]
MTFPPLSPEERVARAEQTRRDLRVRADSEIAWRQDAVDADIATKEETAALSEWKKYRVLLMRVDTTTAPNISWPVKPE